ncbi:MAG: sel1 repeat family protein [Acidobacteria bacterium]|nr:sel1 repeat family protein [Acidobacteriota bacterium]
MKCSLLRRVSTRVLVCAIGTAALAFSAGRPAIAVEPDIPRIQAGAERGFIQQEIELAGAYFAGHGVTRDEKQAAYWYEKAANSGDPGAQLQIGYFYEAGIGVERDPARAASWFQRAAAGGSVAARVNLGVAYTWGVGVRKDPEFATKLFREAADKGSGPGACFLADAYYFGIGVSKDVDKARRWFEVAAKRHDPQGELSLALLLLQQPGQDDEEKAIKLLRDAANSGYVAARHELALRLARKPEFISAPQEALEQLQEASSEGFWKSTVVLGVLYRDGRGVTKDAEAAYVQFRIAALQGGDAAMKMVQNDFRALEPALSSSRIATLNEKAADWMASHNRRLEFVRYPNGGKDFPTFALAYPEDGLHAGRMFPVGESDDLPGETFQP